MILDILIPIYFLDFSHLITAFLFVVVIESFIVNYFLKQRFFYIFGFVFWVNIVTTLLGFMIQIFLRLKVGNILGVSWNDSPILKGLFGEISLSKRQITEFFSTDVMAYYLGTFVFGLLISFFVEYKLFRKFYKTNTKTVLIKAVLLANLASYLFLIGWVMIRDYLSMM